MAQSQLTATSTSQVRDSTASASRVAGMTGVYHHALLIFLYMYFKYRQLNLRMQSDTRPFLLFHLFNNSSVPTTYQTLFYSMRRK